MYKNINMNRKCLTVVVTPANGASNRYYDAAKVENIETFNDLFEFLKNEGWKEFSIKEITIDDFDGIDEKKGEIFFLKGEDFDNYINNNKE